MKPSVALVKKTIYHLADFGEITSQTIEATLEGLATRYPKDVCEAVFEYKITCETYKPRKKVTAPDIVSIDSTPSRRHRTSRLQERSDVRREFIHLAGNYQKQIIERWTCNDPNCSNHNNTCYVDPVSQCHYKLTVAHHKTLGNAIPAGDATLLAFY
jgi:hypothetical protein